MERRMSEPVAAAPPRWSDKRSIAFALCLAASVAFAACLDLFAGGLIHRPPWAIAALLGYSSLPALIGVLAFRTSWRGRGLLVAAAVVGVLVFVPWHPRKRFVNDLYSIRVGMTVEEVRRIMGRYEPRGDETWSGPCPYGAYHGPGDRQIGFAWTSTDWAYDADVGDITFLDGRVVNVEFHPD